MIFFDIFLVFTQKQEIGLFGVFSTTYGVLLLEYHQCKVADKNKLSARFRLLWIISSMFIVMAFHGNLKSSLVRKNYEERTMTLNEMIDKDMTVHITSTFAEYLGATITQHDFNERLLKQAKKKDSIFPIE